MLRHSCAITLGRKLKLISRKKVFKKFGTNLNEPKSKLALAIPSNFISNTKDYRIRKKSTDLLKVFKWSIRTQNLLEVPCVACGAVDKIEIHHIKKLADKAKSRTPVHQIMSKLGRKASTFM